MQTNLKEHERNLSQISQSLIVGDMRSDRPLNSSSKDFFSKLSFKIGELEQLKVAKSDLMHTSCKVLQKLWVSRSSILTESVEISKDKQRAQCEIKRLFTKIVDHQRIGISHMRCLADIDVENKEIDGKIGALNGVIDAIYRSVLLSWRDLTSADRVESNRLLFLYKAKREWFEKSDLVAQNLYRGAVQVFQGTINRMTGAQILAQSLSINDRDTNRKACSLFFKSHQGLCRYYEKKIESLENRLIDEMHTVDVEHRVLGDRDLSVLTYCADFTEVQFAFDCYFKKTQNYSQNLAKHQDLNAQSIQLNGDLCAYPQALSERIFSLRQKIVAYLPPLQGAFCVLQQMLEKASDRPI